MNTGVSGNRVTDLEARWQADVLRLRPDYLSILIGINDVWRHYDNPQMEQVDLHSYTAKLDRLIEQTLPAVKGILVLSLFLSRDQSIRPDACADGYLRGRRSRGCRAPWP